MDWFNVCWKFPELKNSVNGEEDGRLKSKSGEYVHIEVKQSVEETSAMLQTVLQGCDYAANKLALEVHRNVVINDVCTSMLVGFTLDVADLSVWIDPIGFWWCYQYANFY